MLWCKTHTIYTTTIRLQTVVFLHTLLKADTQLVVTVYIFRRYRKTEIVNGNRMTDDVDICHELPRAATVKLDVTGEMNKYSSMKNFLRSAIT